MRIHAVVLAAGSSTRFGATKQLARYRDVPLVVRATRLAERVCADRTVLVAGADWRGVTEACNPLQGFFVYNSAHEEGLSSSIRAGVHAVAHAADAVLLLLADQPLVTEEHLRRLLHEWQAAPRAVIASRYAETVGPPVVFPARLFGELAGLSGDRGARDIIAAEGDRVRIIAFEDGAVDIDRPEDLAALERRAPP